MKQIATFLGIERATGGRTTRAKRQAALRLLRMDHGGSNLSRVGEAIRMTGQTWTLLDVFLRDITSDPVA